ncbi:uncharacterized protein LTR77_010858 [Saxophila tyrrhenica]|uniref:Uncharacterized protein n=1 Tax=Saxophila tyrrhenica TaxID=1690608 RepID=A0AAV9NW63_9PEZI|nr:hypothetical protein LTR77_010858 [Saxophila tyrrhenica]
MHPSAFLASLLPLLAAASPLVERAGGPASVPVPASCAVINPLPFANCGSSNVDGYKPNPDFVTDHLLYQAYFTSGQSQAEDAQQCKEQCFGYGNPGQCKSSFIANQVPTPKGYYGTKGGQLETGCLLFDEYLSPLDFISSKAGRYVNATATDIYCSR